MGSMDVLYPEFIHISRYARWLESEKRRETWDETTYRYVNFFAERFPSLSDEILSLQKYIKDKKVMPSMRCLMSAGQALAKDECAGYNCSYIVIDNIRAFDEALYILMCGTGLGFSVERQYVNKLPEIAEDFYPSDTKIVVPDSKIGWATSFRELLSLLYGGKVPQWDLSRLRPEGARLKVFGGRSSGPLPLDKLFHFTVNMFKKAAGRKLSSIECHDLMCKIAEIVVVGGVRRSALLSLSNVSDDRMRSAKSGQWWVEQGQRQLANNSACYTEKPELSVFLKEWIALYESKSGERGIFSRVAAREKVKKIGRRDPDYDWGCNPCQPANAHVLTPDGIRTFSDIDVGSVIWSGKDWTAVTNKWSTGIKPVYKFKTRAGVFLGTENHRVVQQGEKVEVQFANSIDIALGPGSREEDMDLQDIVNEIVEKEYVGDEEVFDITVDCAEHTYWTDGLLVSNCSEILLRPDSFCNLSEVVIRREDTLEDLKEKVRVATIFGTLQSTLTNFRYLRRAWKRNADEERLLGVSLTGIMDHEIMSGVNYWKNGSVDHKELLKKWLIELREEAISTNEEWSKKLGISPSVAITTVKPSGSVSQLVNSSSGIHARFSPYYIRRVRIDKKDPLCSYMIESGFPGEQDKGNPQAWVFEFPIKSPEGSITVTEIDALKQLEVWKMYQDFWCEHKPSCTVYYTDENFMAVGAWVWQNFDDLSGVSFLPQTDHVYTQAPYEEITEDKYKELLNNMPKDINWTDLANYEEEDNTIGSQTYACTGGTCDVVDLVA